MQFVVHKSDLLSALQNVSKAIPSRTPKPILYGVKLHTTTDSLHITAYNLEIGVQATIKNSPDNSEDILQIGEPGAIVLSAKYFIDIVRKLPHHLVRIDVREYMTTICSGAATFTLNGMDPQEYPPFPQVSDLCGMSISSDVLKSLIERTAFAVATSETRPTLTGVLWQYDDGQLTLTATDSHRLSTHTITVETHRDYALMDSIIPGKSLSELAKILPDTDTLADIMIANNQLLVSFGNIHFYSRLIEGKYPDVSRIIPTSSRTSVQIHTKSFLDSIERALLLARDMENHVIRLHLRRTHIEVASHSPEVGKITENIEPSTFEGEDMLLACNGRYLVDALKALSDDEVRFHFTGSGSAFILRPAHGENHLQLILPVRIVNS